MKRYRKFDLSSRGEDLAEAFLMQYDARIRFLVVKNFPYHLVPIECTELEIDDLVQIARIKLWLAFKREDIVNPTALIARIVRSVIVDMIRRNKHVRSFSTDAEGELRQGHPLMTPGEGMQDPAYEFEKKEIDADQINRIIHAILLLPPRQRYSIACSLNDQLDSIRPFLVLFKAYGIDIEATCWPDDDAKLRSLKTSLVIARKKLRLSISLSLDEHVR